MVYFIILDIFTAVSSTDILQHRGEGSCLVIILKVSHVEQDICTTMNNYVSVYWRASPPPPADN